MQDIVFKAVAFVENGDVSKGRYFYNTTLPDAIDKMMLGMKYELVDGIFQWVPSQKPVNPTNNFKMSISCYYF